MSVTEKSADRLAQKIEETLIGVNSGFHQGLNRKDASWKYMTATTTAGDCPVPLAPTGYLQAEAPIGAFSYSAKALCSK